jgi:neutral ceramidase
MSAAAGDLQAGAAAVDITPPSGVPMAGYYYVRYNEGTHDPLIEAPAGNGGRRDLFRHSVWWAAAAPARLYAKALVFEKDGVKTGLVALDLIGAPRDLVERARVLIEGLTSVPGANVMISATHSHTGPEMGSRLRNVDAEALKKLEEWRAQLPSKIADAVRLADSRLQPVRLTAGLGHEDSISFVRRFRMVDGTVAWNPGKLNPKISAPIGSIDPAVASLFVESPDGKSAIATLVNFANHLDTVGGLRFSSDYAGALARVLDSVKGPAHLSLFTIGCAGNINHIDVRRPDAQRGDGEAARIGSILGAAVLKSHPLATRVAGGDGLLRTRSVSVPLPLAEYRPEEVAQARETLANYGSPNARPFYDQVTAFKVLELEARKGKPLDAEVQVITIGNEVAIVGLPGEIFVDLGKAIKAGSKFPHTIVVELANGSLGYIPDQKAYAEGAYEVVSSRVQQGGGERLVEAALSLLAGLR